MTAPVRHSVTASRILLFVAALLFLAAAVVAFGWLGSDPADVAQAVGFLGLGGASLAAAFVV